MSNQVLTQEIVSSYYCFNEKMEQSVAKYFVLVLACLR